MTHYNLTQLATRNCEHGNGTVCTCARRAPSPSVAEYLKRAKQRLVPGIAYNREFDPHETPDLTPRFHQYSRRAFRWIEHPSRGLRFVGKAHEIRGSGDGNLPYFDRALIDHNGWYMDSYQDSLAWGEVYQLPARNGESVYVPAICTTDDDRNGNDGAILDFHSTTSDLREAIQTADSMAERFAEDEREYQARESAKNRQEEIRDEIKQAYADFKELARELRANCDKVAGLPALRKLLHREYRAVKQTVRELRREHTKLADDFWSIDPEY